MTKWRVLNVFGVLTLLGAGLVTTGCNFTPDFSKTAALSMVQADYDKRAPEPAVIAVDDLGLKQGLNAKLWKLTKVYPNQRWADYVLTDEGKKVIKLEGGGDVIQWRPQQSNNDFHFFIQTVAANHLKAKEIEDPHDDVVANVDSAKSAGFIEVYDWTGVPEPVQTIAHNAINRPAKKRQAEFELASGNWKLHSIN